MPPPPLIKYFYFENRKYENEHLRLFYAKLSGTKYQSAILLLLAIIWYIV